MDDSVSVTEVTDDGSFIIFLQAIFGLWKSKLEVGGMVNVGVTQGRDIDHLCVQL